jgi:hypothetical protein
LELRFVVTANGFVCCRCLKKAEIHARALRPCERGTFGRWHIHCAIELPSHFDAVTLERLIRVCWSKVEWACGRILVRERKRWLDRLHVEGPAKINIRWIL